MPVVVSAFFTAVQYAIIDLGLPVANSLTCVVMVATEHSDTNGRIQIFLKKWREIL